jgi:hypothetical protein
MSLLPFSGAFSFGSSERKVFPVLNPENPSPSHYQNPLPSKCMGISFTKEAKNLPVKSKVPPLGNYKIQFK